MLHGEFENVLGKKEQYDANKEDPFVYMHRIIKAGVEEAAEIYNSGDGDKMLADSEKKL